MTIIISCGCEYTENIEDLDKLLRVWNAEVCTRDPDNPFVDAEISGHYCNKCWEKMQRIENEQL